MDLEGKAGEEILGINKYMCIEENRCTGHAGEQLMTPQCGDHQMNRMGSGVCEGWNSRPELGCDCFSMKFRIIQDYFKATLLQQTFK